MYICIIYVYICIHLLERNILREGNHLLTSQLQKFGFMFGSSAVSAYRVRMNMFQEGPSEGKLICLVLLKYRETGDLVLCW